MLRTQIKMAWRNFWKNRRYTLLNITGLSIALTLFLLTLLYRNNEGRYEHWDPGHENVYRIIHDESGDFYPQTPRPFGTVVRALPVTQAATTVSEYWRAQLLITVGNRQFYQNNVVFSDSAFLKVFQYPLMYGSPGLLDPHTVILSRSLSETLFGPGIDPTGKMITMGEFGLYKVAAVIDRDKYPSHLSFSCIIRRAYPSRDWTSSNVYIYVRCKPHTKPETYNGELDKVYRDMAVDAAMSDTAYVASGQVAKLREDVAQSDFRFAPVDPIHLDSQLKFEWPGNGTGRYVRLLFLVSLLILVMASINFTNLSVAYATRRAKETGLRKVIGALRIGLVGQFLAETLFQCLLAFGIALVLAELLLPVINANLGLGVSGWTNLEALPLVGEVALSILVTTLLAGFYPALVMSGYLPAVVLKGNFSGGSKGVRTRRILLVIQFTCASFFISGIVIITRQISFLKHMDLGFQAGQVMSIEIHDDKTNTNFPPIRQRLSSIPGVQAVSRTSEIQGESTGTMDYQQNGKDIISDFLAVDQDYCAAMGLKLVDGREYDGTHPSDTLHSLLVNEAFARKYGVKVGQTIGHGVRQVTIIGIVRDFHIGNPEDPIEPLSFELLRGNPEDYILLRVQPAGIASTLRNIQAAWSDIEPAYPIRYSFLDEHFATLLKAQEQFTFLFSVLTSLALALAFMGVIALAAYTAERKTKEMSIRKVLGASVGQILVLMNQDFIRWVLLANLLAIPLSIWLMERWLQGFAFRVQLGFMAYVLSFLGCLGATVLIVTLQSLKVSLSSPVKALKYE